MIYNIIQYLAYNNCVIRLFGIKILYDFESITLSKFALLKAESCCNLNLV